MPTLTTLPKIIFFDIDDTLYIKSQDRVPDSVFKALIQLKQQGIIVAIATGRGLGILPKPIVQLIDTIGIELLVTINGQYVAYQGQTLVDYPLRPSQVMTASRYLCEQGIAYAYMTAHEVLAITHSEAMRRGLGSLNLSMPDTAALPLATPMQPIPKIAADMPIYQVLAFYPDNTGITLQLGDDLKSVRWQDTGVDILDGGGSKARGIGAALPLISQKLGIAIDMDSVVAFGDGLNDIEMLTAVGTGVAMGNASPAVQQVADYVCPRHEDDGIYRGLEALGIL